MNSSRLTNNSNYEIMLDPSAVSIFGGSELSVVISQTDLVRDHAQTFSQLSIQKKSEKHIKNYSSIKKSDLRIKGIGTFIAKSRKRNYSPTDNDHEIESENSEDKMN